MPDEPEVHGLLALMLLDDARRDARFDEGELVLLADQDRSRWDAAKIARGREALDRALALQGRGAYVIQAAIASLHMEEPRDWPQIAALYGELVRLTGSAVVELNRAIAVAEADGAEAGLALVDRLDLDGYQYFHSTRADLLRRLGRADEARTEYERAPRARAHRARAPLPAAAPRRSQRVAVTVSGDGCPLPRLPFVVITPPRGEEGGRLRPPPKGSRTRDWPLGPRRPRPPPPPPLGTARSGCGHTPLFSLAPAPRDPGGRRPQLGVRLTVYRRERRRMSRFVSRERGGHDG